MRGEKIEDEPFLWFSDDFSAQPWLIKIMSTLHKIQPEHGLSKQERGEDSMHDSSSDSHGVSLKLVSRKRSQQPKMTSNSSSDHWLFDLEKNDNFVGMSKNKSSTKHDAPTIGLKTLSRKAYNEVYDYPNDNIVVQEHAAQHTSDKDTKQRVINEETKVSASTSGSSKTSPSLLETQPTTRLCFDTADAITYGDRQSDTHHNHLIEALEERISTSEKESSNDDEEFENALTEMMNAIEDALYKTADSTDDTINSGTDSTITSDDASIDHEINDASTIANEHKKVTSTLPARFASLSSDALQTSAFLTNRKIVWLPHLINMISILVTTFNLLIIALFDKSLAITLLCLLLFTVVTMGILTLYIMMNSVESVITKCAHVRQEDEDEPEAKPVEVGEAKIVKIIRVGRPQLMEDEICEEEIKKEQCA